MKYDPLTLQRIQESAGRLANGIGVLTNQMSSGRATSGDLTIIVSAYRQLMERKEELARALMVLSNEIEQKRKTESKLLDTELESSGLTQLQVLAQLDPER